MSAKRQSVSDDSNGYEAIAAEFIALRGASAETRPAVGVLTVREWARTLRPGGAVLDLGCAPGYPITQPHFLSDAYRATPSIQALRISWPHSADANPCPPASGSPGSLVPVVSIRATMPYQLLLASIHG